MSNHNTVAHLSWLPQTYEENRFVTQLSMSRESETLNCVENLRARGKVGLYERVKLLKGEWTNSHEGFCRSKDRIESSLRR